MNSRPPPTPPRARCELSLVLSLRALALPAGRPPFSGKGGKASRPSAAERFKGALMFEGLFQPMHLLVIFGIALLVFGPRKLPELGKGIGEGIRGFKAAMKEEQPRNEGDAS